MTSICLMAMYLRYIDLTYLNHIYLMLYIDLPDAISIYCTIRMYNSHIIIILWAQGF